MSPVSTCVCMGICILYLSISGTHICNLNSDVSVRARVDKLEDGAAESMASERLALPFKGSGFDNHGGHLGRCKKVGYYMVLL